MNVVARRRWALGFLLALTVLDGLLWSAAVPLWQGPDENGHFAVIQFIAEHLRLPDLEDGLRADELSLAANLSDVGRLPYLAAQRQSFSDGRDGPHEQELLALPPETRTSYDIGAPGKLNHTPPLYYLLGALAYRAVYRADLLTRVFAVRVLSILLTAGMVWISYALVRTLSPDHPDAALTVAAWVSFQPMLSFVGSVVNNDILLNLLTAAAIWILLRMWLHGVTVRRAVLLGVMLGLGMLTKPLIAALAPPAALVFARAWWQRRGQRLQVVLLAVLSVVVALALCGGWIVRSFHLNDGGIYMDEVKKGYRVLTQTYFDYRGHFWRHAVDYYHSIVGGVWGSYWAAFGWLETSAPPPFYWAVDAATVLGLLGLVLYLVRVFRRREWSQAGTIGLSILVVLSPVIMMQLYDYSYWVRMGIGRGLQGRYFFGQMPLLLSLVLTGLLAVVPERWHRATHVLLGAAMIAANLYCLLWVVLPRYYT